VHKHIHKSETTPDLITSKGSLLLPVRLGTSLFVAQELFKKECKEWQCSTVVLFGNTIGIGTFI